MLQNSISKGKELKKLKWEPLNWQEVLKSIKEMRAKRDAVVDTMGCERTMEENVEPQVRRYQALVSLMLSSQTKDQVTFGAMERLKTHGLTVQNIINTSNEELGKLIYPVGFWKKKVEYIKKSTVIIRDKFNSDIPDTVEKLIELPGVGPKMAYIAMSVAWEKNVGIGVDTHVHRISNRLGWTTNNDTGTKTPEKTRAALESWVPESEWDDFNILLVGFGQSICTPLNPKCNSCTALPYCPFGQKNNVKLKKKRTSSKSTSSK